MVKLRTEDGELEFDSVDELLEYKRKVEQRRNEDNNAKKVFIVKSSGAVESSVCALGKGKGRTAKQRKQVVNMTADLVMNNDMPIYIAYQKATNSKSNPGPIMTKRIRRAINKIRKKRGLNRITDWHYNQSYTTEDAKSKPFVRRPSSDGISVDEKLKQSALLAYNENICISTAMKRVFNVKYSVGNNYYNKTKEYLKQIQKEHGKKEVATKTSEPTVKKVDKRVERGKFISGRADWLMKNMMLSRDEAWKRAVDECDNKHYNRQDKHKDEKVVPKIIVDDLKLIEDVDDNKLLLTFLKKIVANKGSICKYIEGDALHIDSGIEWEHLVNKLSRSSHVIAAYFGATDQFYTRRNGKQLYFCYGGDNYNYLQQ